MLHPSSTILCHRKAKQAWCALGRAPAEWLAENKGGVYVTQSTESAHVCGALWGWAPGSTAEHPRVSVCTEPTGSLTRDSAPRNITHSFHSLLYLWLKPLLIFHAYGAENIPHPSLLQFYGLFGEATKTIEDIKDFNLAIVREGSAFCWHSQLAKLEWCHFRYPPSSWRILALVRQALKCFTLLLCVFSLFLLTPPLNPVQQSLCSDSTCKRALLCLVSFSWE